MNTDPNGASHCETLLGRTVPGERKSGGWRIIDKVKPDQDGSGGTFSVGYVALHDDGTQAFCKATDIGLLTRCFAADDPLTRMSRALNEQAFEREILEICRGNKLDRIVHAIDYGQIEITENNIRDVVFYIMFEMASGDVRKQINRQKRLGLSWTLHALHNLAVAIQQLHGHKIAHNDVKPSNFLIFDNQLQKLADLGRATSESTNGPWDKIVYSGDTNYAAPEFWYRNNFPMENGKIVFSVRQASDLYHLGSMAFFLLTGQRLTPLMKTFMRPEHNSHNWAGAFTEVLPFVRDALGECMNYIDHELPRDKNGELLREGVSLRATIAQLCEPDPKLRGHPLNVFQKADQYGLSRYISQFDSHAKLIRIHEAVA